MLLENYDEACMQTNMSSETFKETMVESIKLIFQWITKRVEESAVFIHIFEQPLNKIFVDPERFKKNGTHKVCCIRACTDADWWKQDEILEVIRSHEDADNLCTCTTLDLCLQTNSLLDEPTKQIVYDLFFKMFQSYHFKQCLILSYGSNY